jgi:LmbE family N-acetylglucosaminyl deacetylase
MDDAALSCGGALAARREGRTTVVSVVRWSNFAGFGARAAFADRELTSATRLEESRRACAMIGADHRALDEADSMLRFRPAAAWERAPDAAALLTSWLAWQRFGPAPLEVQGLAAKLEEVFTELDADEVWAPLGVGEHVDHAWTRDACLRAFASPSLRSGPRLRLYEDVPYASERPAHAGAIARALASAGAELTRVRQEIGGTFTRKLELVTEYRSQFAPDLARGWVTRAANGKRGRAEWSWSLTRPPDLDALAPGALSLRGAGRCGRSRRLERLLQRRRSLSLFCPGAAGAWAPAVSALREAAPSLEIEIAGSSRYAFEADGEPPDAPVRWLSGGARAWLGEAARAARAGSAIVIAWPSPLPTGRVADELVGFARRAGRSVVLLSPSIGELTIAARRIRVGKRATC